ncbi:MAG: hypothetical protein ACRDZ8_15040 [Acidimicrobiales bacterium]
MSRVRLRPGMHYAPIDGGVYFSIARAAFVVKGPRSLFPVVDSCVPLLEDGSDLDGLVAAVGVEAARSLIGRLLGTFDDRGLLIHLDRLSRPEPPPEERDRFPETLAYLEAHCDDPYAAFHRVRTAHALLIGPAKALAPAVRGLLRAGVRQVIAACDRPEHLARLAARHPQLRLLPLPLGGLPAPQSEPLPDVVVVVSHDEFPSDLVGQLPDSCLTVPVRVGKDLAIVGPAVGAAVAANAGQLTGAVAAEGLWARAGDWQTLDGGELLVQPSGDLLAGALAGQAALDALSGLNPGRVHLVHGPDLASDAITPALASGSTYGPPADAVLRSPQGSPAGSILSSPHGSPAGVALPTPAGEPVGPALPTPTGAPVGEGTNRWHQPMSARWVGLFRLSIPEELPQMPLALTLADGRSHCFQGRVAGFGPDQQTASSEAGLETLRRHCAGLARAGRDQVFAGPAIGGPPPSAVPAAGLDEARGLLDGALRLLARDLLSESDGSEVAWMDLDDVAGRRLWRTLEDHERTPLLVTTSQAAGLGWHLVSIRHRATGAPLATGWGPTCEVGTRVALSYALATAQVRRTVDAGYPAPPRQAGYLAQMHDASFDQLVDGIARSTRRWRLRCQRLAADAVAGAITAWCGWVWTDD